jgi:hypothetical protein
MQHLLVQQRPTREERGVVDLERQMRVDDDPTGSI